MDEITLEVRAVLHEGGEVEKVSGELEIDSTAYRIHGVGECLFP